jgi:dolichyl-phosphate beta-glucosyltransferase
MASVLLVVPCYNEEARLDVDEFVRFTRSRPDVGLLFVNDASTDKTSKAIDAVRDAAPSSVRTLTLERRAGKGEAVRRGIVSALDSPDVRYVGYWDADLSTPLEAVDSFVELLDASPELWLVMGSRVQLLGRSIQRSALRHYVGRVFATAASITLSLAVYDTQCGAKVFRAGEGTADVFREPFGTGWIFDVEIIARMKRHARESGHALQGRLYEMPLMQWHDRKGSKRRLRDYLRAVWDLLFILRSYGHDSWRR